MCIFVYMQSIAIWLYCTVFGKSYIYNYTVMILYICNQLEIAYIVGLYPSLSMLHAKKLEGAVDVHVVM